MECTCLESFATCQPYSNESDKAYLSAVFKRKWQRLFINGLRLKGGLTGASPWSTHNFWTGGHRLLDLLLRKHDGRLQVQISIVLCPRHWVGEARDERTTRNRNHEKSANLARYVHRSFVISSCHNTEQNLAEYFVLKFLNDLIPISYVCFNLVDEIHNDTNRKRKDKLR